MEVAIATWKPATLDNAVPGLAVERKTKRVHGTSLGNAFDCCRKDRPAQFHPITSGIV